MGPQAIAFVSAPDAFPSSVCRPAANSKYVAMTGNDSNPGTLAQPYRTVEKGMKSLGRGAALFIRAGDYYNKAREASPTASTTRNPSSD